MSANSTDPFEEYSQECPVCGEEISVEVPTQVEELAEARLEMEIHEHLREHGTLALLVASVKTFVRDLIR